MTSPFLKGNWHSIYVVILGAGLFSGCATPYENAAIKSWDLMAEGKTEAALNFYENDVTSKKDRLLRLMDEGILLRVGGHYKESNEKLLKAADLIEESGYLSLGEQSVTLLTNEKQTTYRGEDFEKILVHAYLALNFIQLSRWESALVESRKVNEILYKMNSEGKRPYKLNAFARYMGAVLFETQGDYNDAYVAYQNTLKIEPGLETNFSAIQQDLVRMAKKLGFLDRLETYEKKYGHEVSYNAKKSITEKYGSLVFLFESGKSPRKHSTRQNHYRTGSHGGLVEVTLPVALYKRRFSQIQSAVLQVQGINVKTTMLNNIESTAIRHLEDRMGRAIAKALLTASVKAGIAIGVAKATESEELGLLAALLLFATSEADTRSWLLLPAKLQVSKVFLPAGTYEVRVNYLNQYDKTVESEIISDVKIRKNKVTFLERRAFY